MRETFSLLRKRGFIKFFAESSPAYKNLENESKLIKGLSDPKLSPIDLIDIGSRWGMTFREMTSSTSTRRPY